MSDVVMQYGRCIRDAKGDYYAVKRDGKDTVIELQTLMHEPLMRLSGYPALLQLIARLSEVAKDLAREKP